MNLSPNRIRPHNQSLALLTDFYELTMSYAYWKAKLDKQEAVFHLFFRKNPFLGGYTIAAGLEAVIDYLKNFRFDESDLNYLASIKGADDKPLFEPKFFEYLSQIKFSCSIDAIPEGNVVFPYEPLVRVQGPLIQCQLLESPLLNLINFPTLIATKAARICTAAGSDPVIEFGLRRSQGIDGSLTASRSAYLGGCVGTSNVLAGKLFNIPVRGTHSHSWIMAFDDEQESFQVYAEQLPNNCIFLVDTYNTLEGVKKAISVGKWLRQQGKKLVGIRLDSGDLTHLSIKARAMLDAEGFNDATILASNELDETVISELKRQGARINVWAVGTNLVTAASQPALDGVYKLSAIRSPGENWKYKLKLSEQMIKVSNPGILQVKRYTDKDGRYIADAIYDTSIGINENAQIVDPLDATRLKNINKNWPSQDLLIPIFKDGKCVYDSPSLPKIRATTIQELSKLQTGIKRFLNAHEYTVGMEKNLYDLKVQLIKNIRLQTAHNDISSY